MNRSLTEANALPFLHDRNVPGGRLTRENQVAWNRKRSLRPNLVDILRNSMCVSQIKATYTDVWRSNQGISSGLRRSSVMQAIHDKFADVIKRMGRRLVHSINSEKAS